MHLRDGSPKAGADIGRSAGVAMQAKDAAKRWIEGFDDEACDDADGCAGRNGPRGDGLQLNLHPPWLYRR
ncbi:hypothetical protein ERY430_41444 [Erythrobacter sp. EC-HK427]|nr:hypothetical protein ERY430_41444 [Erythrobacter sp. EC-HK427]